MEKFDPPYTEIIAQFSHLNYLDKIFQEKSVDKIQRCNLKKYFWFKKQGSEAYAVIKISI